MITTAIGVEGMTCGHCVRAVSDELGTLPGVTEVEVALVPQGLSRVQVTSDEPLLDDAVRAAVHEAGYEVVSTR